MKEARHLLRLVNRAHRPTEQEPLLAGIRARVQPLGGVAMNLRVTPVALEFDLFCPVDQPVEPYIEALRSVGELATHRRLDLPPAALEPGAVIAEARQLFKEERYWEVHEALEALWKKAQGAEKELLQGIILAAAALVHVQKNEPNVVWTMLEDALGRLHNQPADYHGARVGALREQLKSAILRREMTKFSL